MLDKIKKWLTGQEEQYISLIEEPRKVTVVKKAAKKSPAKKKAPAKKSPAKKTTKKSTKKKK